jgi:hypothetical protein
MLALIGCSSGSVTPATPAVEATSHSPVIQEASSTPRPTFRPRPARTPTTKRTATPDVDARRTALTRELQPPDVYATATAQYREVLSHIETVQAELDLTPSPIPPTPFITATPAPYSTDERLYAADLKERIDWYSDYLTRLVASLESAENDPALYRDVEWRLGVLNDSVFLAQLSNLVLGDEPLPRFQEVHSKLVVVANSSWDATDMVKEAYDGNTPATSYNKAEQHARQALADLNEAKTTFQALNVPVIEE